MCKVLHIGSLCALQAGDLGLQEVIAQSLFRVLGFEPVDLCGLRPQLGLDRLTLALAGDLLGFQATLQDLQLRLEVRRTQRCGRRGGRSNGVSVPATSVPVCATYGAEPLTSPGRFESGPALFAILLVHVDSSVTLSGAT
jgi:hypothetical protein